jgi:hypothetical protein
MKEKVNNMFLFLVQIHYIDKKNSKSNFDCVIIVNYK